MGIINNLPTADAGTVIKGDTIQAKSTEVLNKGDFVQIEKTIGSDSSIDTSSAFTNTYTINPIGVSLPALTYSIIHYRDDQYIIAYFTNTATTIYVSLIKLNSDNTITTLDTKTITNSTQAVQNNYGIYLSKDPDYSNIWVSYATGSSTATTQRYSAITRIYVLTNSLSINNTYNYTARSGSGTYYGWNIIAYTVKNTNDFGKMLHTIEGYRSGSATSYAVSPVYCDKSGNFSRSSTTLFSISSTNNVKYTVSSNTVGNYLVLYFRYSSSMIYMFVLDNNDWRNRYDISADTSTQYVVGSVGIQDKYSILFRAGSSTSTALHYATCTMEGFDVSKIYTSNVSNTTKEMFRGAQSIPGTDYFVMLILNNSKLTYRVYKVETTGMITLITTITSNASVNTSNYNIDFRYVSDNTFICLYYSTSPSNGLRIDKLVVDVNSSASVLYSYMKVDLPVILDDIDSVGIALRDANVGDSINVAVPYIRRSITYTASNCAITMSGQSKPTIITNRQSYTLTITPNQYYELPNVITVTGCDSQYSVDNDGIGTLILSNPVSNVNVTINTIYVGINWNNNSAAHTYGSINHTIFLSSAYGGSGQYIYTIKSQKYGSSTGTDVTAFNLNYDEYTHSLSLYYNNLEDIEGGYYYIVIRCMDTVTGQTKDATITVNVRYTTISLQGNGGTITPTTIYGKYGTNEFYNSGAIPSLVTITATRDGYNYLGLFTSASSGTMVITSIGELLPNTIISDSNGNINITTTRTLYAHWELIE